MTSYRPHSFERPSRGRRFFLVATLFVIVLIVTDILLEGSLRIRAREFLSPITHSTAIIWRVITQTEVWSSRATLLAENARLQDEVERMRARDLLTSFVFEENESLRALVRIRDEEGGVVAPVLSSFRASPFDSFVLGAGGGEGIEKGMLVLTNTGFLIGEILDVGEHTSTARFLFANGARTDAAVGSMGLFLEGRGRTQARAEVPREAPVAVNDTVVATSYARPIGVIGSIESASSSVYSMLFVHVPTNLNMLREVIIVPFERPADEAP